jgi:hypothetical protein
MGAGLGVVDFTAAAAVTRAEVSTAAAVTQVEDSTAEGSMAEADAAATVNGIFSRMDRR